MEKRHCGPMTSLLRSNFEGFAKDKEINVIIKKEPRTRSEYPPVAAARPEEARKEKKNKIK